MDKIMTLDHHEIIKALKLVPVKWIDTRYDTEMGLFYADGSYTDTPTGDVPLGFMRRFKNEQGHWAQAYRHVDDFTAAALMEKCWREWLANHEYCPEYDIAYEGGEWSVQLFLDPPQEEGADPFCLYGEALLLALARAIIAVKGEME